MITRYSSISDLLFRRVKDRIAGRPSGRIGVIGGADGPTAFFVARRMKPRYDPGRLSISVDPAAVRSAARTSLAFALIVALLSTVLYYTLGRKR